MRKIEVVEKPCKGAIFSIDRFAFKLSEDAKRCMIKYQIDLELKNYQPIDVRFLLEDMDSTLEFLLPTPEEVTKYISQYDEKNDPSDECLFHDIRTKYMSELKLQEEKCMIVCWNMNDFLNIDISLGKYHEMEYNSRSEKSRKAG